MRSLFWRILATFWLALALVAGLAILLGRALQQDAWILWQHPALESLAQRWTPIYEEMGPEVAQAALEAHKRRHRVDVQVLDEAGHPVVWGTFPARAAVFEARSENSDRRLPWRRLTEEYTSPQSGQRYLFIYRIPHGELLAWQREHLFWPIGAGVVALVVLTAFSLLLALSITRPLGRLRRAVHDLGQTSYQQDSLARLSLRRDELGLLARDFNRMGERLQTQIQSQRQLLRDVSHELRSPLARLRVATALAERATPEERETIWPRLTRECDRLEALIGEILALARLDAEPGTARDCDLHQLTEQLRQQATLAHPALRIDNRIPPGLTLRGWPDMLERALDNLLRNAARFTPTDQPIEVHMQESADRLQLSVRDHGPGAPDEDLARLGTPFFRGSKPTGAGHGLGLAIARRAAERHGGQLRLSNHPEGGFVATLDLPRTPPATPQSDEPVG